MENIKYWSWTDELVEEFISRDPSIHRCKEDILEFKQSKQPKEEEYIFFTKKQLDAMMGNVWNAARDAYRIQIPNTGYKLGDVKFKYESFKDYQQSLPENKQEVDKEQAFQREIQKEYCAPNPKSETQLTSNSSINCQNEGAEKPPLGLMPLWLWKEHRLQAVTEAIERCKEAGKEIPQVWIDEQYLLTIK